MTMQRREFITLLSGAGILWPRVILAQQQGMPVIGVLSATSREPNNMAAFRDGLRDEGFIEGKNFVAEYRWAEGAYDRLAGLVAELVRRPVSLIFATGGNASSVAARAATLTIPVVFTTGSDPVQEGLLESLARPGGNITGATFFARELTQKRLELLHELVPQFEVIAVLVNPTNPNSQADMADIEAAGRALGLKLHILQASTASEINNALSNAASVQASALFVNSDAFLTSRRRQVVDLAERYRLPAVYPRREHVLVGGLLSYNTNVDETYRQAGSYVGRILKGEKPGNLPVQQPTRFTLVVNSNTARALGLTIPASILVRADEVIE